MLASPDRRWLALAGGSGRPSLGCFGNSRYLGRWLAGRHRRIAVLGAASRGEFREEDQMCCAQVAAVLVAAGDAPQGRTTAELGGRWGDAPADAWLGGPSGAYFRRTGPRDGLD